MEQIIRFGLSLGLALLLTACGPDASTNNSTTDSGGGIPSGVEIVVSENAVDSRTLTFSVLAPRAAATWHWDFGDGATANGASVTHNYAADGRYTITVTAPGRDTSASTSVTVNSAPVAAFSGAVGGNRTLRLNAGASSDDGGRIETYHWRFGDGAESDGVTVSHEYAAAGSYDVTLTVTDDLGGSTSITQQYTVAAAPLRIVAIGDSITQANSSHKSYRYELWKLLKGQDVSFDFVGSHATNSGGNPNWPTYNGSQFDPDNEGHWGWRADEIRDNIGTWLNLYDADIALIHIGTNDLLQQANESVEQTAGEIRAIIKKLRADNPNISILLSNLIPFSGAPAKLQDLNARIKTLASELDRSTSRVFFVDQNTGYTVLNNYDGIHPKPIGEEKMAEKWFDALRLNNLI